MKISHFMPFFAQKSPAARLDATSSMACLQQAKQGGAGEMGTRMGTRMGVNGLLQPSTAGSDSHIQL